jgi:hypothetical protein
MCSPNRPSFCLAALLFVGSAAPAVARAQESPSPASARAADPSPPNGFVQGDLRELAEEDSGLDAVDRASVRRGERFFGMPIEVSVAGQLTVQKGVSPSSPAGFGAGNSLVLLVRLPLGRGPVERAPVPVSPWTSGPYQRLSETAVVAASSARRVARGRRYRLPGPIVQRTVRAALSANGLGSDDSRLTHIATRARMSAVMPELRLRVVRGVDQSLRLLPTDADPYRTQATDGASMLYEARATWRLDRLVFADEEIAVERLRAERASERRKLLRAVLDAIGAYQRARGAPEASPEERADKEARLAAAGATLDGLTDGAWSTLMAGVDSAEPADDGE